MARPNETRAPLPYGRILHNTPWAWEDDLMIWMRNLLFLGLVGGGVFAVGYNLMPPRAPKARDALRRRRLQPTRFPRHRRSGRCLVPSAVGRGEGAAGGAGARSAGRPPAGAGPDGHRAVARGNPPDRNAARRNNGCPGGSTTSCKTAASPTTSPSGWPAPTSAPRTGRSSSIAAVASSPGCTTQLADNRPLRRRSSAT